MIPTFSAALIILIGVTAFIHNDKGCYALLCFSTARISIAFVDQTISDTYLSYYYLLCSMLELFIIYTLSRVKTPDNTILMLIEASIAFIYLNLFGWITYELYIEPLMYNILCASLFLAVLVGSINTRIKNGLGSDSIHSDRSLIFSNINSWSRMAQRNKKAKGP